MSAALYAEKYNDYSIEELEEIVNSSSTFGEYARLGAIQVLENRKGESEELNRLKSLIANDNNELIEEEHPPLYLSLIHI